MLYLVKHRFGTGAPIVVHQFPASSSAEADERFTDFMAERLEKLGFRFVSYLPTTDGKHVSESTMADPITELPPWYRGEGFYDASDQLIMRYNSPMTGDDPFITDITIGENMYWVEPEKTYNTMEVCALLHVTRRTILRWVRKGSIVPVPGYGNKHIFTDAEVSRIMNTRPAANKRKTIIP